MQISHKKFCDLQLKFSNLLNIDKFINENKYIE